MKQKDDITPPSKADLVPETSEQQVERMRAERNMFRKNADELTDRIDAEVNYETSLTDAAKLLKIDRSTLDNTYGTNKGELVKKFRLAKGDGTAPIHISGSLIFTSMAAFVVYLGIALDKVEAGLLVPLGLPVVAASVFAYLGKKQYSRQNNERKAIKDTVTEHQKRLSDMSAPNPA